MSPALTVIRLKGVSSLEAIQLQFNNGADESPFVGLVPDHDSLPHSPESTQLDMIHTYKVDGSKQISSVKVRIDRHVLITGIEMLFEDGSVAMTHSFDPSGVTYTQEIDSNHTLIGVYGK